MTVYAQPLPWEYQPTLDNGPSYAAFQFFLLMPPPRRLNIVAIQFGISSPTVSVWSTKGYWRDRAHQYDQHMYAFYREERERLVKEDARETAAQWLETARTQKALADREMGKLLQRSLASDLPVLSARDIRTYIAEALKTERLTRGQATEIVSDAELDLSALTDAELEQYEQLQQKATAKRSV